MKGEIKMINFLFGWITKNQFQITMLESFIAVAEILIGFFIGCVLYVWIKEKIKKIQDKRRKEK